MSTTQNKQMPAEEGFYDLSRYDFLSGDISVFGENCRRIALHGIVIMIIKKRWAGFLTLYFHVYSRKSTKKDSSCITKLLPFFSFKDSLCIIENIGGGGLIFKSI